LMPHDSTSNERGGDDANKARVPPTDLLPTE
jgi:hypothetical protein